MSGSNFHLRSSGDIQALNDEVIYPGYYNLDGGSGTLGVYRSLLSCSQCSTWDDQFKPTVFSYQGPGKVPVVAIAFPTFAQLVDTVGASDKTATGAVVRWVQRGVVILGAMVHDAEDPDYTRQLIARSWNGKSKPKALLPTRMGAEETSVHYCTALMRVRNEDEYESDARFVYKTAPQSRFSVCDELNNDENAIFIKWCAGNEDTTNSETVDQLDIRIPATL